MTTKSHTFPPPGTHLYSWVNWGIVERTRMPKLRNGSKGGDSNPDSLDCKSGIILLSYSAPQYKTLCWWIHWVGTRWPTALLTWGWMGSAKLQIMISDGVMMMLAAWSMRSSSRYFSPIATAMMPLIDGCQSMSVTVLFLLNCRSVNDWYSCGSNIRYISPTKDSTGLSIIFILKEKIGQFKINAKLCNYIT